MKRKLLTFGAVAAIAIAGASIVYGAGTLVMTSKLGVPVGTSFRFDGEIRTRTLFTRDGLVLNGPITTTAATGSVLKPIALNGSLTVSGLVTGNVNYVTTVTGFTPTTVQGAIDQLGLPVANVISGATIAASGVTVPTTVSATTWKGYAYDDCSTTFRKSAEVTVTFTPTSATAGSYSSTPINLFAPSDQACNSVATGTFTGTYFVVGDTIMGIPTAGTNTVIRASLHGTTLTTVELKNAAPNVVMTLVRQ